MRHPLPLSNQLATLQSVAHLYNEATCTHRAATVLIRIEGRNLEKIRRLAYESV